MDVALLSVSLAVNVLVLIPVCSGIALDTDRMAVVFGPQTPARDILLAVYIAILLCSASLLALLHIGHTSGPARWMSTALLAVQVVYKLLTAVLVKVGAPKALPVNPVVASNQLIAALHIATIGVHLSSAAPC